MATMTNAGDVQRYIKSLEATVRDEQTERQRLEAQVKKQQIEINFLESFIATVGSKLGVRQRSRQALDAMVRAIDELISKRR